MSDTSTLPFSPLTDAGLLARIDDLSPATSSAGILAYIEACQARTNRFLAALRTGAAA